MSDLLLQDYQHATGFFDEMMTEAGGVRPHWREFIDFLHSTGAEALPEYQEYLRRCVRDNGVTYNVYADPQGADRAWSLDVLPMILPEDEWRGIEAAMAQRADVLNHVLVDLYGSQSLLREGLIPPALVYGHDGYLWPCQGVRPSNGQYLHLYAADLARSPDGQWWVIADRTQVPSGLGYALENRSIVAQLFPEHLNALNVQPLTRCVDAFFANLLALAPIDSGETPHMVMLTPGGLNETYFEHAYLARHLGVPLVEGQDLTVRGQNVYLKTLTGLQRVHGILRRLDDDFCDPLELRAGSALGVPGLMQVVRAGRVIISNALGSGVLESPGLLAFLPAIAEHLTGSPLLMPAVATWWCGEVPAKDFVLKHLDRLVIKPTYPSQSMEPVFGYTLSEDERQSWMARIARLPQAYVAQELVALAQAPVVTEQGDAKIVPRSVGLRVYAVATAQGYQIIPGGLTRVASAEHAKVISMQRGGSSKDTWVRSSQKLSFDPHTQPPQARHDRVRADPHLVSRTAENIFWLGRYSDRVEFMARLLREALSGALDTTRASSAGQRRLLEQLCSWGLLPVAVDVGKLQRHLIQGISQQGGGSLVDIVASAIWSASHLKDRLSVEHLQSLNRLNLALQNGAAVRMRPHQALARLDTSLRECKTLSGFAWEGMRRDAAWYLHRAGRHVERLQHATFLWGLWLRADDPCLGLDTLLALFDSTECYRYRYQKEAELIAALDLTVWDEENPRSVIFQVDSLEISLNRLSILMGFVTPGIFVDAS
ncbi:MAG: circularly permuted type 2 ATP-grasp protein, partial [Pseudomonadales bacterium]|nr:circularly permuted type 2 ATP-grasp protein [Pseudomonadales bacterium]